MGRALKIGLGIGGLVFAVGVGTLTLAIVRGWSAANEVLHPSPKTAEADAEPHAWPEPAKADADDPAPKAEAGEATLLVSRALHLAAARRSWSAEARLVCTGPGCVSEAAKPTEIEVRPGMAVKWAHDWQAGESEAWTESLASDLIAGRPDALDELKLRFAGDDAVADLQRSKHRVVEFWDPGRERAGMWAVIAERKAKVVALAWLGANDGETRWTLELDT